MIFEDPNVGLGLPTAMARSKATLALCGRGDDGRFGEAEPGRHDGSRRWCIHPRKMWNIAGKKWKITWNSHVSLQLAGKNLGFQEETW